MEFTRVLRFLGIYQIDGLLAKKNNDSKKICLIIVLRYMFRLIFMIFATMFISASLLLILEGDENTSFIYPPTILDYFYYVLITLSTFGYGDIYA